MPLSEAEICMALLSSGSKSGGDIMGCCDLRADDKYSLLERCLSTRGGLTLPDGCRPADMREAMPWAKRCRLGLNPVGVGLTNSFM